MPIDNFVLGSGRALVLQAYPPSLCAAAGALRGVPYYYSRLESASGGELFGGAGLRE